MMGPFWGIDLGGTKIEAVVIEDLTNMRVIRRRRIPTESSKGYAHILKQIHRLIEVLSNEIGLGPNQIGVGTPGTLSPENGLIKNANTTCLNREPLKRDLEEIFKFPVRIANDANCFALAEYKYGVIPKKMPEASVVFGVILGTGVGGGLIVNGQLIEGKHGIAGEWGHNVLEEKGNACYCGKESCIETFLAGPALEDYYASIAGRRLSMKEIMSNYHLNEDTIAIKTVDRLLEYFGKSMAQVINILDPDAVILGGGLGNIELLYKEGLSHVEKYVFNENLQTPFLKPILGDSAGVFGAVLLNSHQ